jgi:ABC-type transport system involved in cytochrome bd biosynthesis fused ATPase/permease subunit
METTEHTKFIILRYDNYINAANTKGNFLLAFNIFLCGGIVANHNNLVLMVATAPAAAWLNVLLAILFVAGIVTTALIMISVYPFLRAGNSSKDKYHTMIFFNSVADFSSADEYATELSKQNEEERSMDMSKQAYTLARSLRSKYRYLAIAMRLVFAELLILLIIFYLISTY